MEANRRAFATKGIEFLNGDQPGVRLKARGGERRPRRSLRRSA